jgi:hypothetical protein
MTAQTQIVIDFRFIVPCTPYRQIRSPTLAAAREVAADYQTESGRPVEIQYISMFAPKGALCAGTAKAEGEKQERPDFRPASPYENKQRKSSY